MAQTNRQTDRQTHGHGDSMTNSAQWGRVGESYGFLVNKMFYPSAVGELGYKKNQFYLIFN